MTKLYMNWEVLEGHEYCDTVGCGKDAQWERQVRDDGVTHVQTSPSELTMTPKEAHLQVSVQKYCGRHKEMIDQITRNPTITADTLR